MGVKKYGRTTGYTHGTIDAIGATIDVCYETRGPFRCVQSARFVNQIVITPGTFSSGGDSGSLIVTDDNNNNPVALLFAGSDTHTIGSPIDVILDNFGVTVDDGNNVVPPADVTDIAVTNISAVPNNTAIGNLVNIEVTVSNIGDVDVTDDIVIKLTDNSSSLTNWTIKGGLATDALPTVVNYTWNTQSSSTGIHAITAALEYSDDNNGNNSNSTEVELTDGSTPAITLTATGYKIKGVRWVHLEWDEIVGSDVAINITRDGSDFLPVNEDITNSTAEIEIGKIGGTFTFVVCESGSINCSNEAIVIF
jgi:hypothetical protein